jgi:hypothetical protein
VFNDSASTLNNVVRKYKSVKSIVEEWPQFLEDRHEGIVNISVGSSFEVVATLNELTYHFHSFTDIL